ncbi:MAG: hypothetical protein GAK30_00047 [Paracidovorax wautersii]|uniref:HTH cro/C1-type domain-containing protein n=1 Tax=Paracidovorax wautersii TaxID=1177982 RepID=A0A7V8FSC7_9BURK|nr:MAG: hypothetical protein GAK30_00047 [Paracidovorax wautersii]
MQVQKFRLRRGWSQQQLADASGLSLRTVQRIEAGHAGSVESYKSLAAVFEVDFTELQPQELAMTATDSPVSPASAPAVDHLALRQEQEAFDYVRRLRRFYRSLAVYLALLVLWAVVHLGFHASRGWMAWVAGIWGVMLLVRAVRLWGPDWGLGPDWERRVIEKRLGRPL